MKRFKKERKNNLGIPNASMSRLYGVTESASDSSNQFHSIELHKCEEKTWNQLQRYIREGDNRCNIVEV